MYDDVTDRMVAEMALHESEERYRTLFNRLPIGLYRITTNGKVIDANPALVRMLKFPSIELLMSVNLNEQYLNAQVRKEWQERIEKDDFIRGFETKWKCYDGSFVWISESARIVKNKDGKLLYYEGSVEDITQRRQDEERIKAALVEKEVLLKEVHHRVKNNLQIMSSLLDLQADQVREEEALNTIKESQNRIRTIALVHDGLYHSDDLAKIDFSEYLHGLVDNLLRSYKVSLNLIHTLIDVKSVYLNVDKAIPCGLIINELVSNSLKYAFPNGKIGEIRIVFTKDGENSRNGHSEYTMIVSDNGVGLPVDFDVKNCRSLGLTLVHTLIKQLRGNVDMCRDEGTRFNIKFTA